MALTLTDSHALHGREAVEFVGPDVSVLRRGPGVHEGACVHEVVLCCCRPL